MNEKNSGKLATIRALLAKAERASTDAEAEAFSDKAAELMAKYGVDAALAAQREPERDQIVTKAILVENPYPFARMHLLNGIASALRCQGVYWWARGQKPMPIKYKMTGYASDIERVEVLFTSLSLQATSSMLRQPNGDPAFRRTFLMGYASAVGAKLRAAEHRAAAESQASGTGAELVLADRSALVKQEFDRVAGKTRTMKAGRYSGDGYGIGYREGQRADIGGTGVSSGRKGALTS